MPAEPRPMTDDEIAEALLPLGRVLLAAMERYAAELDRHGPAVADLLTGRAPKALPPPRRRRRGGR